MRLESRLFAALAIFFFTRRLHASDWPGFRGNKGGVSDDVDVPAKLTKDNILWKIKLPGAGTSSPIIVGDKIFLTANAGYGTSITKGMTGGGAGGKGGFPGKGA